jgi:hypothetical protein
MRAIADVLRDLIEAVVAIVIVGLCLAFAASPLILIGLLIWRAAS